METSKGLDRKLATTSYSHVRLTQRLLRLVLAGSPQLSQVIPVLATGEESRTFFCDNNLGPKENCSLRDSRCQAITMTVTFFRELARKSPGISIVHAYPGCLKTGLTKEAEFVIKAATNLTFKLLSP